MTNYAVTNWDSGPEGSVNDALEALETYIETIVDSKTIRAMGVLPMGTKFFVAWVVHDA